jgi:hypothetical protein
MSKLNVFVLNDDGGGFIAVMRDVYSEIFRTERHASDKNARHEMLVWINDTMPGGSVHWHARAKSDYDACHPEEAKAGAP